VLWQRIVLPDESPAVGVDGQEWNAIMRLLTLRTGVDFSEYKPTPIRRRLARQMILAKCADLAAYLKLLQNDPDEVNKLYDSLLINVTEFFRDPEYFDFLRDTIIPRILQQFPSGRPLRVWVPGCATGEEAYSLGMLLREVLDEKGLNIPMQIFGTDVSEQAIATARAGTYSPGDVANVSAARLARFFQPTERGYLIHKSIRDHCVFARQNVVKDSPFSRIDLISCRNLLIYLGPKLQRKIIPIFHYSLNPTGYLVLGSSESVGANADYFRLVDRRFRIYSRKSTGRRTSLEFGGDPQASTPATFPKPVAPATVQDGKDVDVAREADRIVLHRHGPNGVLVNDNLDILQFRGDVSAYLAPTAGRASLNLLRMARDGLAGELQSAIEEAREKSVRVQRTNVAVLHDDGPLAVHIDVTPIDAPQTRDRFYLVLFTPASAAAKRSSIAGPSAKSSKIAPQEKMEQLRRDLEATRHYLHTTIQKHETTNEELRAANEEIQSSNEELQSTNEELETAKEELQSTNEELTTVNEELHNRQLELVQVNNDLQNLINSVHVPIVILGQDMRIRRFTPMAERVLKVIPSDIGRPLSDINTELTITDLPRLVTEVIETLNHKEMEVQDSKGRWYSLRLRPYRTADNKIEGVVLALFDIDMLKRSLAEAEEARNLAQTVIETTSEPLVVLTPELNIKSANDAFYQLFKTTEAKGAGQPIFNLVHEAAKKDSLKRVFEAILPTSTRLTNHEISIDLPGAGPTSLIINVRQIASAVRTYPLILLSFPTR
jgi:two-component system, chemotaxis family, CheB/CheR fusion protein